MSIKHLIEWPRVLLRRGCYARDQEVGNVQTITRGGDATGAGSPQGESLLSRQAGVSPTMEDGALGLMYELAAGTGFGVFPSSGKPSGTHTQMAIEVEDVEGTVKDLQSKGVKFEDIDTPGLKTVNGIADFGGSKGAWFKDSEGNLIALGVPVPVAARPRA